MYRVLRSGKPSFKTEDGSYLDKYSFNDVTFEDAGTYVCVATNNIGYSYREITVNVLPGELLTTNSHLTIIICFAR